MKRMCRIICAGCLVVVGAWGAEQMEKEKGPAEIDRQASQVLHQTAQFYKQLKKFSVQVHFSLLASAPGSRREMWTTYDVAIERPNKAAFIVSEGTGLT